MHVLFGVKKGHFPQRDIYVCFLPLYAPPPTPVSIDATNPVVFLAFLYILGRYVANMLNLATRLALFPAKQSSLPIEKTTSFCYEKTEGEPCPIPSPSPLRMIIMVHNCREYLIYIFLVGHVMAGMNMAMTLRRKRNIKINKLR